MATVYARNIQMSIVSTDGESVYIIYPQTVASNVLTRNNINVNGQSSNNLEIILNNMNTQFTNMINGKADSAHTHPTSQITGLGGAASMNYTSSVTSGSSSLITSGAVYSALSGKADSSALGTAASKNYTATLSSDSDDLITSGAGYTSIANILISMCTFKVTSIEKMTGTDSHEPYFMICFKGIPWNSRYSSQSNKYDVNMIYTLSSNSQSASMVLPQEHSTYYAFLGELLYVSRTITTTIIGTTYTSNEAKLILPAGIYMVKDMSAPHTIVSTGTYTMYPYLIGYDNENRFWSDYNSGWVNTPQLMFNGSTNKWIGVEKVFSIE